MDLPPVDVLNPVAQLERFRPFLTMLATVQVDPRLRGRLETADLVQQTLLVACRQITHFRGTTDGERAAWLRRILAGILADALKSLRRLKRDAGREIHLDAAIDRSSAGLADWLAADQTSPSGCAQRDEQAVALADALSSLPESQRDAIVLQFWHGWSLKQIAERLDSTPVAVAGLLKRGLKRLRHLMNDDSITPSQEQP